MGIRKNQACLSASEKAAFVTAVKTLKANGTYDIFVQQHRTAMLFSNPDPAHRGPAFLPWHREFLRRFELALQAINPAVTIPYWDWTINNSPSSSLWNDDFMGGNGEGPSDQVQTGPFAHSTGNWTLTVLDPGETDPFLKRRFGVAAPALPTVSQVRSAIGVVPYDSAPWGSGASGFRDRLERAPLHDRVHVWVGGSMMAASSPNDPVFWLHHCNIDRLWALWQHEHPDQGYLPLTGTPGAPPGHARDDPMPPWAGEPTPPTPARVLDHLALGYSYDTLFLAGAVLEAEGKPTLLRAHNRGTGFGPAEDFLNVEVVVTLDSAPGRAFGFQLRNDGNEATRKGMLDLLRNAFNHDRRVKLDYVLTGSCNGRILRVVNIP